MTEVITRKVVANEDDLNRDPLTGTPGAHPVGTTAGATSGAVAGGVAGLAVGGPVGGLVGLAVGAVAGGLAGKSAAEAVNPTAEEQYWRETFIQKSMVLIRSRQGSATLDPPDTSRTPSGFYVRMGRS